MNTATVPNDLPWLTHEPHPRPYRAGHPGMRKSIEGSPYASWGIGQRELPADAQRDHSWPVLDEGEAQLFMGDYYIDDAKHRVIYRPSNPFDFFAVTELLREVRWLRDENEGAFADGSTEPVPLVKTVEVSRCSEPKCLFFQGWHAKFQKDEHTAVDLSKQAYWCRLVSDKGVWVPDIRWRNQHPSSEQVASYISDAHWLLAEMSKMGLTPPSLTR